MTYEDGRIVVGATVYADPIGKVMAGIAPQSQTDSTGNFEIDQLSWGRYCVSAAQEDEGYPAKLSAFFTRNHEAQIVTLDADNPTVTVTIRLGPKAGILTGTVVDAVISMRLNPCADFRWAADPDNLLTGTGLVNAKFRMLIPSGTDVLWKVWLDGYKPWYYLGHAGTTDQSVAGSVRWELWSSREKHPRRGWRFSYAKCALPFESIARACRRSVMEPTAPISRAN
ncbi:MAG TPA: carboxypeptidase-like regulatory domain-containing protein [Bryobacteraceae bacterium]|nr:carboxypeptidase-like regulatory domain-containing protein [Bryobacteraceae bacterium]